MNTFNTLLKNISTINPDIDQPKLPHPPIQQLQSHLLNLWTSYSVDQTYQNLFLIYIETFQQPKEQSKQIEIQIKKTYQKTSLYFLLQQNLVLRTQIKSQIQQQIVKQTQNGSIRKPHKLEIILRQLCDKLKNLRRINLLIAQNILKIFQDFKVTRQSSLGSVGKKYIEIFMKIDIQNEAIKQSFLNQYILFQKGYDPFFLIHYQEMKKSQNPITLKKYQAVSQLFQINISYVYRLMRAQQKMLKYMLLIDDHTGTQKQRKQIINRQRLLKIANNHKNNTYQQNDIMDSSSFLPVINKTRQRNDPAQNMSVASTIKPFIPLLSRKPNFLRSNQGVNQLQQRPYSRKKIYSLKPIESYDIQQALQNKKSHYFTPKNGHRHHSLNPIKSPIGEGSNAYKSQNSKNFQTEDEPFSMRRRDQILQDSRSEQIQDSKFESRNSLLNSQSQKKWNIKKVIKERHMLRKQAGRDIIQEGSEQNENEFMYRKKIPQLQNEYPMYVNLKKSKLADSQSEDFQRSRIRKKQKQSKSKRQKQSKNRKQQKKKKQRKSKQIDSESQDQKEKKRKQKQKDKKRRSKQNDEDENKQKRNKKQSMKQQRQGKKQKDKIQKKKQRKQRQQKKKKEQKKQKQEKKQRKKKSESEQDYKEDVELLSSQESNSQKSQQQQQSSISSKGNQRESQSDTNSQSNQSSSVSNQSDDNSEQIQDLKQSKDIKNKNKDLKSNNKDVKNNNQVNDKTLYNQHQKKNIKNKKQNKSTPSQQPQLSKQHKNKSKSSKQQPKSGKPQNQYYPKQSNNKQPKTKQSNKLNNDINQSPKSNNKHQNIKNSSLTNQPIKQDTKSIKKQDKNLLNPTKSQKSNQLKSNKNYKSEFQKQPIKKLSQNKSNQKKAKQNSVQINDDTKSVSQVPLPKTQKIPSKNQSPKPNKKQTAKQQKNNKQKPQQNKQKSNNSEKNQSNSNQLSSSSKIKMVPGKLTFQQFIPYIKQKKFNSSYNQKVQQNLKFISTSAQHTQTYVNQFHLDQKLASIALCSPSSSGNIVIYLWAPIQGVCDDKTSQFFFKKYLDYLQQQTTFKSILYCGAQINELKNEGFTHQKDKNYIRKRTKAITRQNFQFEYFFSMEVTNICFIQTTQDSLFFSDQISPLSQSNSWCDPIILNAKQNQLQEELEQDWTVQQKIKSITQANMILQKDSYDTFQVGQQKIIFQNINMSRSMLSQVPKKGFIANEGFMIIMGKTLTINDYKRKVCKMELMNEVCLYFGSGFKSVKQMGQFLIKGKQNAKQQDCKFAFKMFSKQLYGRYLIKDNKLEKGKAFYCNWDMNFAWRDEIPGKIVHNVLSIKNRFGPQSFNCLVEINGVLCLGVEIQKEDFFY